MKIQKRTIVDNGMTTAEAILEAIRNYPQCEERRQSGENEIALGEIIKLTQSESYYTDWTQDPENMEVIETFIHENLYGMHQCKECGLWYGEDDAPYLFQESVGMCIFCTIK